MVTSRLKPPITLFFLGLLLLNGSIQIPSAQHSVRTASIPVVAFPKVGLLGATTDLANLNLSGVWQDGDGRTYSVLEGPTDSPNTYFIFATYLTDQFCPAMVGDDAFSANFNSTGVVTSNHSLMYRCTSATNPIVENCSQPARWMTSFNATLTATKINGQYLDQHWTWDTGSNGAITNCRNDYNFPQPFSLTLVVSSSNSSSGTTTSQEQSSSVQISSSSTTNSTTTTTSSSSTSGAPGPSGGLIAAVVVAAVVVLLAAALVYRTFLRKKP